MEKEAFLQSCREIGIELDDRQIKQFDRYAELLTEWNSRMNLTAITQYEEILEKHFYDSLLASQCVKMEGSLCDVGAGAGFPSVVLKIVFPDLKVTILEPLKKRCIFLNEVIDQLKLEQITVMNSRAEDAAKELRESFDIVTARAVANLRVLSELCIPLVRIGGVFLAMKGAQGLNEDKEAEKAIKTLGCRLASVKEVTLRDEAKRVNLVYEKKKPTPMQYPRMYSKIKKNPL